MKAFKSLFLFLIISGSLFAQDITPATSKTVISSIPTTEEILAPAFKQAALEKKNVIIIFHASWCGWCKKMDKAMNDPLVSKYFSDNYITVHLDVLERADKKNLENSGAFDLLKKYNGEEAGLPFFLILNKNRELLADSYMRSSGPSGISEKPANTGCPAEDSEVGYFISILKKTSKLDDKELAVIAERFKKNKSN